MVDDQILASEPAPIADRPLVPDGYGIPSDTASLLPWSYVDGQMNQARNYWVGTTRPDGRPHAMPVWGVWLDRVFYFEGNPFTRRGRNLARNPAVVVHLESGDQVLILEGEAREIKEPALSLTRSLSRAFSSKYAWANYHPEPDSWDRGGLYAMHPKVVIGWSHFPQDATRWKLP
jgi:hypothetical protein